MSSPPARSQDTPGCRASQRRDLPRPARRPCIHTPSAYLAPSGPDREAVETPSSNVIHARSHVAAHASALRGNVVAAPASLAAHTLSQDVIETYILYNPARPTSTGPPSVGRRKLPRPPSPPRKLARSKGNPRSAATRSHGWYLPSASPLARGHLRSLLRTALDSPSWISYVMSTPSFAFFFPSCSNAAICSSFM